MVGVASALSSWGEQPRGSTAAAHRSSTVIRSGNLGSQRPGIQEIVPGGNKAFSGWIRSVPTSARHALESISLSYTTICPAIKENWLMPLAGGCRNCANSRANWIRRDDCRRSELRSLHSTDD